MIFILLVLFKCALGLVFREDQFTDMTKACLKNDGKPIRHILNADNPAMYVSIDGNHDLKKLKRAERNRLFKKITSDQYNQKRLLQDLASGRSQLFNDLKLIQDLASAPNLDQLLDLKSDEFDTNNTSFNCKLHFETELPQGDKSGEKYDALSLFIVEYHPSQAASVGLIKRPKVEVITYGHQGYQR